MRIVSEISAHEMARRFAIGEVTSQFFASGDHRYREETLAFLASGDKGLELEGIRRHHKTRGSFVKSIPPSTRWHIARLELSMDEFQRLNTIRDTGWIDLTNSTLKLVDVAQLMEKDPGRDPRLAEVITACKRGRLELRGITLFGQTEEGSLTIVEGTARLVALYLACVLRKASPHCAQNVEVVLGISDTTWRWS